MQLDLNNISEEFNCGMKKKKNDLDINEFLRILQVRQMKNEWSEE